MGKAQAIVALKEDGCAIYPPNDLVAKAVSKRPDIESAGTVQLTCRVQCHGSTLRPDYRAEAAGFKEGVHKWKEDERDELLAELDAAFFHLYELSREDAEYVLSTFSGMSDDEGTLIGSGPSKLILDCYDQFSAR